MEKSIYIDEAAIAKYLFQRLVEDGYAPDTDELLDLAEYVFDFLMEVGSIEEENVNVREVSVDGDFSIFEDEDDDWEEN